MWLVALSKSSQPEQCVWSYVSFPNLDTPPSKWGADFPLAGVHTVPCDGLDKYDPADVILLLLEENS